MNKAELITAACDPDNGMSKAKTELIVDRVLDAITMALADGDEVRLIGFGTFTAVERAARAGRNPRTGAPLQIAASKWAKFKAGKKLHDQINPVQRQRQRKRA